DGALVHEQKKFAQAHPLFINGKAVKGTASFDKHCPFDMKRSLGKFQSGSRDHVRKAISAARNALPFWIELGWPARVSFLRKAAELFQKHQFELAALLSYEVGKNRFEAIAEVSESIDLILYYCQQMESHQGYWLAMGGSGMEHTRSILKP